MDVTLSSNLKAELDHYGVSKVPGFQYRVVDASNAIFEYTGGWADIQNKKPMALSTTMMAYSMTKTFTAAAILQLIENGEVQLDDPIDRYLTDEPYHHDITIRQLVDHTSGIPNPIPLRWVHLSSDTASFDEDSALVKVLHDHPKLDFAPGTKYAYSNIGYWLLGKIIEKASGCTYTEYMQANIIRPLGLSPQEMDFVIHDPAHHANGYLVKYSLTNLIKGLVIDSKFLGGYEGNWLRLNSHHLNGPAFGGLIGTATAFGRFLQDQLQENSRLFNPETKKLFYTRQSTSAGVPIKMTLGWHTGDLQGTPYFYKEGGGGGFHSEMRIYPERRIGTVVMVNATDFNSNKILSLFDRQMLLS